MINSRQAITRLQASLLVVIVVIAAIAGGVYYLTPAPKPPPPPPPPKKLTVWWSTPVFAKEKELIPKYVEQFKTSAGAEVDWVSFPHVELDLKIMTAVEAGTNPDIIFQAHQHVCTILHEKGKLMPLTDVIDKIDRKDIFPFLLEKLARGRDGVEYFLPYYPQGNWFHYRKDILAKAGYTKPPETLDQLLEIARKINNPEGGLYALGFPLGSTTINDAPMTFEQILWAYGGQLVSEDGKTMMINSTATMKTLEFFEQIIKVDKTQTTAALTWGAYDNNVAFQSLANIAITGNPGGTIVAWMRDNNPKLYPHCGTAPWPKGPTGKHYLLLGAMGFSIFKNTKNPELAKDFVRFFCEKSRYKELVMATVPYNYPMYKSLLDDPVLKDPPMWEMYSQLLDDNIEKRPWGYATGPTAAVAEVYSAEIYARMIERIAVWGWTPRRALNEGTIAIRDIYLKWSY
nr:sugar ABC transporter substrate-binding protein [Candidatus Njordarchaeum guaymaensis]